MIQYAIVIIIVVIAASIAVSKLWHTLRQPADCCQGCNGCKLKEQMKERQCSKGEKGEKEPCFKKKQ